MCFERAFELTRECRARGCGVRAVLQQREAECLLEQRGEIQDHALRVAEEQHHAAVQVPAQVDGLGGRDDLLAQAHHHSIFDLELLVAAQFRLLAASELALLFVADLRLEQRAGDAIAIDAEAEQHEAVVEHLGRVELEIERPLHDAPAGSLERFVFGLERLEHAQLGGLQEFAAQVLGQRALREKASKCQRSAASSQRK